MVNKMYVVHYTNGVIDQIWGNKTDVPDLHNEICSGANAAYAGTALEYYAGSGSTVTYDGQALRIGSDAPINVVGVTPVVGTWAADLSNKVIHVIYNKTTTKALQVYITDVAESPSDSGVIDPASVATITVGQMSYDDTNDKFVVKASCATAVTATKLTVTIKTTDNVLVTSYTVADSGWTAGTVYDLDVPYVAVSGNGNYVVTVTSHNGANLVATGTATVHVA